MAREVVTSIQQSFENVTDPRVNRGHNHNLLDMVFITICAVISGADGWADVERFGKARRGWLQQFLTLSYGIPSHDTFGRVFARLDTTEFYNAVWNWLVRFRKSLKGQGIAIDGKTLRGSFDTAAGQSPLHLVSAFACDLRVCLGQVAVDKKSNEITAVPKLTGTARTHRSRGHAGRHALPTRHRDRNPETRSRLHLGSQRKSTNASLGSV